MFSGKSLMYRENNKEPTTEPRGTPELTGISDERSSSSTTLKAPNQKGFNPRKNYTSDSMLVQLEQEL